MTPITERLTANPRWTHRLAWAAFALALAGFVYTGVAHYTESNRITQQDARQAKAQAAASAAELRRLQAAFCGTAGDPGLLPTIATAPTSVSTSPLGHALVVGSQRAVAVIQCGPR
jgi:hypothetical protein